MTASAAPGGLQLSWIKEQVAFDTILGYAATDAVSHIAMKIDPSRTFEKSKEALGTFSLEDEYVTVRGGKWSASYYIKPAAAGTAPDIGPLIKAALGSTETVVGGTSVTYPLSDSVAPIALQGLLNISAKLQNCFSGAWVDEMTIEIPGQGMPTISFSGGFARYGWAYADVVGTGDIAFGASSVPINDASRGSFGVGSVIQFTGDDGGTAGVVESGSHGTFDLSEEEVLTIKVDGGATQTVTFADTDFSNPDAGTALEVCTKINSSTTGCTAHVTNTDYVSITSDTVGSSSSIQVTGGTANAILSFSTDAVAGSAGSGYAITAVSNTQGAATLTISPACVSRAGHAAGVAIYPWVTASRTVGGTAISTPESTLTIDSVNLGFLSAKITVKTGIIPREKEATTDRASGLFRGGERTIEGEFKFYFEDTADGNAPILGRTWDGTERDVDFRVGGSTAGSHMHISLPACRLDVGSLDIPDSDVVTWSCKFVAHKYSTAADEFSLVFD